MIDVKQIFESIILDEALGNLNSIPNARAKKVIESLLKDAKTRMFAEVSPNSAIEKIGSYSDISSFNAELKKFTALGHRVGAIVFLPSDGSGIVTVITDHRYIEDGAVRNDLKVRSSDFVRGYGRFGNETTLGKVYTGYINTNLKESDNVEVYAILRDPTLVGKVAARRDSKDVNDPYAPIPFIQGQTTKFMRNAAVKASANAVVDTNTNSFLDVIKKLEFIEKSAKRSSTDTNAKFVLKVGANTYDVEVTSVWLGHHQDVLIGLAVTGTPFKIASMYALDGSNASRLVLFVDKQLKFSVKLY